MTQPPNQASLVRLFQAQYRDFTDDIEMYLELAAMHGGPILELGCGSGRVLLELARAGFSTVGLDHDLNMLLRIGNQTEMGQSVELVQAKLEDLPFSAKFGMIISPCSTFGHLNESQLLQSLAHARRLMAANGRLVVDLPAPTQSPLDEEDDDLLEWFHEPERGTDVQVSADQRMISASLFEIDWHYDELLPDGHVERHSFTRRYHLRDVAEMERILAMVGFAIEDAFGDYQRAHFTAASSGFILIAKPQTT